MNNICHDELLNAFHRTLNLFLIFAFRNRFFFCLPSLIRATSSCVWNLNGNLRKSCCSEFNSANRSETYLKNLYNRYNFILYLLGNAFFFFLEIRCLRWIGVIKICGNLSNRIDQLLVTNIVNTLVTHFEALCATRVCSKTECFSRTFSVV